MRSILTPLKELAEQLHVLVLGIAHFNKKDDIKSALLRVSDSIAYVAAARHVYAVLDDPEDHTLKLFVKAKNNLAPEKITALKYGFGVNTNVGHDAKLNLDISAPYIMWMAQTDIAANDAMAAADGHSSSAKREAKEFLQEALREGPALQQEVIADAKANGISQATLRRAGRLEGRNPINPEGGKRRLDVGTAEDAHPPRERMMSMLSIFAYVRVLIY